MSRTSQTSRTIGIDILKRVEGEGQFWVKTEGNRVVEARFRVFEPPRFFEAFLRGRRFDEVNDIVSRICGICPVAYQMSAVHAIEDAFGVKVGEQIRALRRLIYCGEWIESNALSVHLLHGPDFLGYPDALTMARDHREAVERACGSRRRATRSWPGSAEGRSTRSTSGPAGSTARRSLPTCSGSPRG